MSGKIIEMILSFPFKQLGEMLRKLSLSSDGGNIGAWILYVAICLIPTLVFIVRLAKKKRAVEDLLLLVISVALFYVMYVMVNPSTAMSYNYITEDYIGYGTFGGIIYSAIVGYLVLNLIRKFGGAKQEKMCRWLNVLLCVVNIVLVLNMLVGLEQTIDTVKNVNESNYDEIADTFSVMNEVVYDGVPEEFYEEMEENPELAETLGFTEYGNYGLGLDVNSLVKLTEVFLILRYIVSIVPVITAIIVIFMLQRFLKEYVRSGISEETVLCGNKVSAVAIKAAVINVLVNIGFNMLQLVFFKKLLNKYADVELPLVSLIFILAMPLITKLITTSKEIKEENEMFV